MEFYWKTMGKPWENHGKMVIYIVIDGLVGGDWNMTGLWLSHHIGNGMSSSQLTNSYFSRWLLHHQPDRMISQYPLFFPWLNLRFPRTIYGWEKSNFTMVYDTQITSTLWYSWLLYPDIMFGELAKKVPGMINPWLGMVTLPPNKKWWLEDGKQRIQHFRRCAQLPSWITTLGIFHPEGSR